MSEQQKLEVALARLEESLGGVVGVIANITTGWLK